MDATTAPDSRSSLAASGAILAQMEAAAPLRAYGSKAERIYDALRLEFVRGAWPFGKTFTTYELAERFGVSRRPVMDAVQRLQADGFVEVMPQVGCRVVVPDERQLREHLELSMVLEAPAARMAAERATPADVHRLEQIHERTTPIVEAGDGAAYPPLNREFHTAILEMAGNRRLAEIAASAWDLREFFFHPYLHPGVVAVMPERHQDHARILAAIRAADPDAAEAAMHAHLDPTSALEIVRAANHPAAATGTPPA
jgi:DNA-binding GntR family transcriptional regulator